MLIWMREGAGAGVVKFILMGLLVFAVAGLVLMDVGGFFRGQMSSNTVAKGKNININAVELDRVVRRQLAQQGIGADEAMRLGMIDSILAALIQSRAFNEEAHELGLAVDDTSVMAHVARLAEPLAAEGRSKKEALRQLLASQGLSEGEFITMIREEMANGILRTAITPPSTLTSPLMAQALYRYDSEKRGADIVILPNDAIKDAKPATDEQIQSYYESNKHDFMIPESRRITIATLKPDMLRNNVTITEDRLKSEYEKNIASFTKPTRRLLEQAVFPDETAARVAIDGLKNGTKLEGATTQEFEQNGLLPEIATPAFSAKKDEIVGPVQTSLGWHVIVVRDILPEIVSPYADIKEKLRTELENMSLNEEMYNTGNTIEDRVAAGDTLEDLVREYGMTTEIFGPFRQNGNNSDGEDLFKSYAADRAKIIQAAFDYEEGEIAPVVETSDGYFYLIRIDQVVPDAYRPYDSVKSGLQKRWIDEQRRLMNRERSQAMLDAVNGGKKLDDLARENGARVQGVSGINRRSQPPAPLTPIVAAKIFTTDKGKAFSAETEDGYIVGIVNDVFIPAKAPEDSEDLKQLSDMISRSAPQEIMGLYLEKLTSSRDVRINRPLVERMYGAQAQQQAQ